ncbi:MAG: hypothetical protein AB8B60_05550 [Sulfitobacter sp.]
METAKAPHFDPFMVQFCKRSLTLIDNGNGPRVAIEPDAADVARISEIGLTQLAQRVDAINHGLADKTLSLVTGTSSLHMRDAAEGLEILAPGLLNIELYQERHRGGVDMPLLVKEGQWIPPGIQLSLTSQETDALIAALLSGSHLAVRTLFETYGVVAEIAGPLAIALLVLAAEVAIMRAVSPKGAVGFKICLAPLLVVGYPRF